MNTVLIWYMICNLPNPYVKNLSSESGSVFEKLKNCLNVIIKFTPKTKRAFHVFGEKIIKDNFKK